MTLLRDWLAQHRSSRCTCRRVPTSLLNPVQISPPLVHGDRIAVDVDFDAVLSATLSDTGNLEAGVSSGVRAVFDWPPGSRRRN